MKPAPAFPPPPAGLIVELVTPLTADGDLDREALTRLVERVAPAADGLLAGSPGAGEALDLPFETRRELIAQTLAAVAGRLPLFLGITGQAVDETRELAAAVREDCRRLAYAGPVLLADLPLWYHSNRGLPQVCQGLLGEAAPPLVLLNLPEVIHRRAPLFKHRNLRTQVFKRLAALPGVVGLIYQGEMRRFLNYHYAASRRPEFAFYEADEANFLTRPGAWGVLSASAQILPEVWQQVTWVCLHPEEVADDHGRRLELWDLSQRLLEIVRLCRGRSPALLKTALAAQGVLPGATTAPATPPAPASHLEPLLAALAAFPGC
jgi:dihydrodipicolinate synthase/N-acetylneuraminate lyase